MICILISRLIATYFAIVYVKSVMRMHTIDIMTPIYVNASRNRSAGLLSPVGSSRGETSLKKEKEIIKKKRH